MTPHLIAKLLAYALCPSASDAATENAGSKALRLAKAEGMTVADLASVLGATPNDPGVETLILPFGKYTGMTLLSVWQADPGYVRWIVRNVHDADPILLQAAGELCRRRQP